MNKLTNPAHQTGSILVATALSLLVILGMAGLAIDTGFSLSNKTRLQNSVDAAAIAASMKLLKDLQDNLGEDTLVSTAAANAAGTAVHKANLQEFGAQWLTSPSDIEFCWSRDLQDFDDCSADVNFSSKHVDSDAVFFVRAQVASTSLNNFIMQVMPGIGATKSVGAVAVAGTSGLEFDCNVAPIFVCDKSGTTPPDDDCSDDDDGDGKADCWGRPVTLDTDAAVATTVVDPTHFFTVKEGANPAPKTDQTEIKIKGVKQTVGCTDSNVTFETDGCVILKDQRVQDGPVTNAYVLKHAPEDWRFNPSVNFNGNFGFLDLVDANGNATECKKDKGLPAIQCNFLSSNACIKSSETDVDIEDKKNQDSTDPGNKVAFRHAFNAIFGEPDGNFNGGGNPMPLDIQNYYDNVLNQPISYNYYRLLYEKATPPWSSSPPKFHQRLKNVPVLDCSGKDFTVSGKVTGVKVLGYACFFFNRKMYKNEDGKLKNNEDFIIAEHVDNDKCPPIVGLGRGEATNILKATVILYQYLQNADS